MDGWVKWLGEMVWRICKLPKGIRDNEGDENFWFRLYGLLSLLGSLGVGMLIIKAKLEVLSKLLVALNSYSGGDKILVQGYFTAGIILILAAPVIFCVAVVLAMVVSILPAIALRLSAIAAWTSYEWAKRFKKQQIATKELSPRDQENLWFLFLGLLAAFIIWFALKTGTKPDGDSPAAAPLETGSDQPSDSDKAAPPAA